MTKISSLTNKLEKDIEKKLPSGELDNRNIEIEVSALMTAGIGMIGGGMTGEASLLDLQDMLGSLLPKRTKIKKVTIAEAKHILLSGEMSKLFDMDALKEEALQKAQHTVIIFIDEID